MDNSNLSPDVSADSENVVKTFPGRGFCLFMLLLFYVFLFYGSLTPFVFKPVQIGWNDGVSQILATGGHVESQMDWYVNLFLGIPAGFFMLGVLCLDKKTFWSAICALPVILVCFLMAFIVERLQLYTVNRNCALSDIAAQTFGAGIGCVIWAISGQAIWDELRRFWNGSGIQSAISVLTAFYFFALIIDAWSPFDVVYVLGDIWGRWKSHVIFWIPLSEYGSGITFSDISRLLFYVFLYVPIGTYIQWKSARVRMQDETSVSQRQRLIRDYPLLYTTLFALSVSVILLFGQFFIQSRILYATNILLAVLSAMLGCVAFRMSSSGYSLAVSIVSFIAILVAMIGYYWTPFNFSLDAFKDSFVFSIYQLIPLADYQRSHTITAINRLLTSLEISVVITISLRYIIGTLKYGGRATLAICGFIFTLMEGGQLFLPDRTFTFSDIILQTLFSAGIIKVLPFFQNIPVISVKQDK